METMNYKDVCKMADKIMVLLQKETHRQQELIGIVLNECQNRCNVMTQLNYASKTGKAIKS